MRKSESTLLWGDQGFMKVKGRLRSISNYLLKVALFQSLIRKLQTSRLWNIRELRDKKRPSGDLEGAAGLFAGEQPPAEVEGVFKKGRRMGVRESVDRRRGDRAARRGARRCRRSS